MECGVDGGALSVTCERLALRLGSCGRGLLGGILLNREFSRQVMSI